MGFYVVTNLSVFSFVCLLVFLCRSRDKFPPPVSTTVVTPTLVGRDQERDRVKVRVPETSPPLTSSLRGASGPGSGSGATPRFGSRRYLLSNCRDSDVKELGFCLQY